MEAIKEVAFEVGGTGEEGSLSIARSHAAIYFTGHVDPVLDCVLRQSFSVIDFVQDFRV